MSLKATSWVWKHSPLKGAAFAVHLAIADTVDKRGVIYMHRDLLGAKARVHPNNVSVILTAMVEAGLIELADDRRWRHQANRYRLLFPDLPAVYETRDATADTRDATADVANRVDSDARRDSGSNGYEQEREREGEHTHSVSEDHFPDFWKAYPRKEKKPAALKAWKTATTRASVENIAAGFERWRQHWLDRYGDSTQYVPMAATWLNNDQWQDDPPKAPTSTSGTGETRAQRNARATLRVVGLDLDDVLRED